MYSIDFEYDKKRLSEYGMMICSFNGSSGIESVSSGADITFNQGKSSGYDKFYIYSSTYNDAFTATFQICKNPCICNSQKDLFLSPQEISKIQMWLCRKNYNKFKIDQNGYRDIYWMATFSSKQIILNGNIVGLELTMYTNSPYAYRDEIEIKLLQNSNEKNTFLNLSDKEGYIYPDMKIKIINSGNLLLKLNNRITKVTECNKNEVITIKGDKQIITTSDDSHSIAKCFNFVFPRIESCFENNKNEISTNIDCEINITYSPVVLVGL